MKKNVLITGASGNLGKAAVLRFRAEGYRVIAVVSPGKTLPYPVDAGVFTFDADLTDEATVEKVVREVIDRFQTVEAALLLAGGFAMGNIFNTDAQALRKMFSLNFDTTYPIARCMFQRMIGQAEGGRIVMIGSRPALKAPEGKTKLAYGLSKSLLFKLAEYLNAEGASGKVTASVIVPSIIDTEENRNNMPDADYTSWVKAEDIADAMLYLCSEKGRSLREPVLKIYGGA